MAEAVEYALVVMASSLLVAGSVAAYGSFSSFEASLQFKAEFQAVSTLASAALVNGNSTATLSVPASTIGCESGRLTVSSGSMTGSQETGFPCDFQASVPQGTHVLTFAVRSSTLTLAVS